MPEAAQNFVPGALRIAGCDMLADPFGALVLEREGLIVVADLHLEKGSSLARRGVFLPPYDTATTLLFLSRLIARWRPRAVVALGDSFHDGEGPARLCERDRATLRGLQTGREWIWALGNHDEALFAASAKDVARDIGGDIRAEMKIAGLTLRHEPTRSAAPGEIAGHLHPAARVVGASGSTRRRCFLGDDDRCVLPAFGAYAGGLNILDDAFAPLFPRGGARAHVLGRGKVYRIGLNSCAPENR